MRRKTTDLIRFAAMTALALTLSVSESLFFPDALFPVPGMRLGLANVVTLLSIYLWGEGPTLLILVTRCLLTFFFGGNLTAFLFSLAGGLLALLAMTLARNTGRFSFFGVSTAGSAAHNIGQITVAALLTRSTAVVSYLPVLLAAGIVTGLLIAGLAIPVYRAVIRIRPGGDT